jgi:hypothetical protein
MVVERTFVVTPSDYGEPVLTDPQEMLGVEIDSAKTDCEAFVGLSVAELERGNYGNKFEVTGEVVEE